MSQTAEPTGAIPESSWEKSVVVTGAAGAIGREIALAFARAGARVCVVDLAEEPLAELVGELPGDGHGYLVQDLADIAGLDGLPERVRQRTGPSGTLVHAAAVLRRTGIFDVTEEEWDLQVNVNLKATFFLNMSLARHFREHGGGSIVNFTSQGWWSGGFNGSVVYNTTKGGIVTMTKGLARSLAPDAIRVNAVAPGFIDTPMLAGGLDDAALAGLSGQVPMARLGQPSELAGAVVYLASPAASYVTGTVLNVSGGLLMY
ncbi:SDR family NAD(P)-dependent oxidoreductase [Dactylosporangium sp. CA-233914]|uniref:SDR family NAD(P)-dependent oxidoreductase n=1 Tax=Dactylosporangium sp. CA-233914 TaxID=3239934 RepID=UPI003D8DEE63